MCCSMASTLQKAFLLCKVSLYVSFLYHTSMGIFELLFIEFLTLGQWKNLYMFKKWIASYFELI